MARALPILRPSHARKGMSLIYITMIMTVLMAFASLAVDLGRAQLAKTELRRAADAAARYGAQGFATNSVSANAIAAAAQNKVDGTALVLLAGDITTVTWNPNSGTVIPGNPSPNAVQITAKRINSRSTGIPLLFASVLGQRTLDLSVTSIASYTAASNISLSPKAMNNPWLAGMPNGTTGNDFDTAPHSAPTQVTGITVTGGKTFQFDFSGAVSYLPSKGSFGPDGNLIRMIYNCYYDSFAAGREHGMSNLTAPITSVVGVFLDAGRPDTEGAPPPDLDFSDTTDRDFTTLSPMLRQPFFIGDGLMNDDVTSQTFIAPTGATRLFIGVMDGQQWSDNTGSFSTSVSQPVSIKLVR